MVSIQGTLTGNGPMILDATCSFSKIWPKSASIRIDIRPEVNPDIVMDAKDLKFPDNYFDAIYCDPPHLIRSGSIERIKQVRRLRGRRSPDMFTRYGWWDSHLDWFYFIDCTNKEFYRCLKKNGLLHYKITEAEKCTKTEDLITLMTNFEVVSDTIVPSRSGFQKKSKAHYIVFRPKNSNS